MAEDIFTTLSYMRDVLLLQFAYFKYEYARRDDIEFVEPPRAGWEILIPFRSVGTSRDNNKMRVMVSPIETMPAHVDADTGAYRQAQFCMAIRLMNYGNVIECRDDGRQPFLTARNMTRGIFITMQQQPCLMGLLHDHIKWNATFHMESASASEMPCYVAVARSRDAHRPHIDIFLEDALLSIHLRKIIKGLVEASQP
jgi:hypothetical protein